MASVDDMGMRADGKMETRVESSDCVGVRVALVDEGALRN